MSIALHTSDAAVMAALHARDDVMDGDTQGLFPTDDDLWVLLEREKAPHDCCYDKVRFLITLYEGALALKFSIFVVAEPNDSVFMRLTSMLYVHCSNCQRSSSSSKFIDYGHM